MILTVNLPKTSPPIPQLDYWNEDYSTLSATKLSNQYENHLNTKYLRPGSPNGDLIIALPIRRKQGHLRPLTSPQPRLRPRQRRPSPLGRVNEPIHRRPLDPKVVLVPEKKSSFSLTEPGSAQQVARLTWTKPYYGVSHLNTQRGAFQFSVENHTTFCMAYYLPMMNQPFTNYVERAFDTVGESANPNGWKPACPPARSQSMTNAEKIKKPVLTI